MNMILLTRIKKFLFHVWFNPHFVTGYFNGNGTFTITRRISRLRAFFRKNWE